TGRTDRVDADARAAELEGVALREPALTPFGGGVRADAVHADHAVDRPDVDDRAPSLPLHDRDHRARAEERPDQIDLVDAPEGLERGVLDRPDVEDRRVVDESV